MLQYDEFIAHLLLVLKNYPVFLVSSSLYYFRNTEAVNCIQVVNF